MGISEWMCYYANYDKASGGATDIDECIALHLERGIDHLVWNAGRSVVDYWSDLPAATRMCQVDDQVGGRSWAFVAAVMRHACPLRRALEYCRAHGVPLLARLGMNRHYGSANYAGVTSRFALENSQFREVSKQGNEAASRLCYAIEAVRQERIDILLEIQRIGADGLVLDFCRQMPMLMYHPALVEPYMEQSGCDPREIDSDDPEEYREWFQYRAAVLTGFMEDLRRGVRRQEEELGQPCPIIARVPDNAPWLMVAYGLDTERWCAEDLVDGLMLSPFPITRQDLELHCEHHIETAHRYGKKAQPVYALADRQYRTGADAMSLYQSESLVRMEYLDQLLQEVGDRELVGRRTVELPNPGLPDDDPIGMDWHCHMRGRYGLRVADVGDAAL